MVARDWFNVTSLAAPLAVLFGFGFGFFAGPAMSPIVEAGWIAAAVVVAGLSWWSTAQSARGTRLSKQHDQDISQQLKGLADVTGEPAASKVLGAAAAKILALENDLTTLRDRVPRWRTVTDDQSKRFKKALGAKQTYLSGGLVCRAGDTEAEYYTQKLIWLFRESGMPMGGYGFTSDTSFNLKGLEIVANDVDALSDHCRLLMEAFDAAGITYKLVQNPNVNVQTARASGGKNLGLFFLRVGENDE
jgi:hypothetical protein